jgi:hypothetical protein
MCRSIYDKHERYWEDRRPELRRLRNAYQMRYWMRTNYDQRGEMLVETSRAYELVESYVASLFMRDPAVVVRGDLRGRGDQDKAQALANDWLTHVRRQMEDALRLAIIYPWAALKVAPRSHPDPLQRVTVAALPPWDVLVDDTARAWDYQRYVGVRVMMPVEEARERYGRKQWATRTFRQFLDRNGDEDAPSYGPDDEDAIGEFVEVVEFYDLTGDRFLVWSPDYANGSKWVADGVELEVGVEDPVSEKVDSIPVRTADDYPLVPVVPLYLSREPDRPLRGYSGLRRVYDQVQESNTIRTYQANGVRRAARQWLVQKGTLDAESMAKMVMGQDGEFIEVETSPGQQLAGAIVPVPHLPVPAELQTYLNQVDEDFARGSILAPFTRGEATKATATEVTAMGYRPAGRGIRGHGPAISRRRAGGGPLERPSAGHPSRRPRRGLHVLRAGLRSHSGLGGRPKVRAHRRRPAAPRARSPSRTGPLGTGPSAGPPGVLPPRRGRGRSGGRDPRTSAGGHGRTSAGRTADGRRAGPRHNGTRNRTR